ncbi:hypothetical protein B0H34DRAFT_278996 [Crassisporium funariophilum]|nr:hypothetical protein B0H34DRAFT_278996 [Crassisporium funariophilum]
MDIERGQNTQITQALNQPSGPSGDVFQHNASPERALAPFQGDPFRTAENSPGSGTRGSLPAVNAPLSSSSAERHDNTNILAGMPELQRNGVNSGLGSGYPRPPSPARMPEGGSGYRRPRTVDTHMSNGPRSAVDWIVPMGEKVGEHTVGERLQPTLKVAIEAKEKYAMKAKWTGYALNAAIGLQVLLGSLTTGLSAVATTGKSTAMQTTILGALATLVASYLARARGSNEPELSIARVKDLEQFIRECEAFRLDHGHITGADLDLKLITFRHRFEELLGNGNGERRLSPPA